MCYVFAYVWHFLCIEILYLEFVKGRLQKHSFRVEIFKRRKKGDYKTTYWLYHKTKSYRFVIWFSYLLDMFVDTWITKIRDRVQYLMGNVQCFFILEARVRHDDPVSVSFCSFGSSPNAKYLFSSTLRCDVFVRLLEVETKQGVIIACRICIKTSFRNLMSKMCVSYAKSCVFISSGFLLQYLPFPPSFTT